MGAVLIFIVAAMAAGGVNGVNPAQIGLVLVYAFGRSGFIISFANTKFSSYCVSLTQMFGMVTRQSAEVEVRGIAFDSFVVPDQRVQNNMNAVERTVHYTRKDYIEQEAAYEIPETKPPADWPRGGNLQFRDVVLQYRASLPPVLHGISFEIRDGEKIGVVGRTGAGKSSLMIALYRIVELSGGSISLDGIDISTVGLFDLRSKVRVHNPAYHFRSYNVML